MPERSTGASKILALIYVVVDDIKKSSKVEDYQLEDLTQYSVMYTMKCIMEEMPEGERIKKLIEEHGTKVFQRVLEIGQEEVLRLIEIDIKDSINDYYLHEAILECIKNSKSMEGLSKIMTMLWLYTGGNKNKDLIITDIELNTLFNSRYKVNNIVYSILLKEE